MSSNVLAQGGPAAVGDVREESCTEKRVETENRPNDPCGGFRGPAARLLAKSFEKECHALFPVRQVEHLGNDLVEPCLVVGKRGGQIGVHLLGREPFLKLLMLKTNLLNS